MKAKKKVWFTCDRNRIAIAEAILAQTNQLAIISIHQTIKNLTKRVTHEVKAVTTAFGSLWLKTIKNRSKAIA